VLKKSKAENCTLFIDASKECVKVTNNNKLTPQNIVAILGAYTGRVDTVYYSRLVPNADIAAQHATGGGSSNKSGPRTGSGDPRSGSQPGPQGRGAAATKL